MENTIRMSLKVTKEIHAELKNEAASRGLTLQALLVFILEERYKSSKKRS